MSNSKELYTSYKDVTQKAADLQFAAAVLGWDQEVYMPPKGFEMRGRQLATLASQAHEMLTAESYGKLLTQLRESAGLDETEQHNVRLSLEDYEKNRKLPISFVEQLTQQTSNSYNAWLQARKDNKYSTYTAELAKMIDLKRKQADYFGYQNHPYDALLDEYEKGATVAMLDPIFKNVKEQLPPFLTQIANAQQVDDSFFNGQYPKQQQWDFSIDVLKKMGYDFEAGRQDYSEHPFTTSFSSEDVRITTRVDEHNYASMLWSSIHEGGHALYEQGLPSGEYGLPLGSAASLAVHESQSRLWENCVGRSLGFWKYFYPHLQQYFPQQLGKVPLDTFYKGMNKVEPSLIRTEADEVTYHFHVLIRYEIEKQLIAGTLQAAELDQVWNEHYKQYLGVSSPDAKQGVLQDVHWSHGMFGYFPTYSLGSFYAAQFFEQAVKDMPGLPAEIEQGQFSMLLDWLRGHVHVHGRRYTSEELCKRITGRGLDLGSFMNYIKAKYSIVYGLK
ncbi:MAG: carboxypeptidase M32 [Bacteroidetes bacterium]|nr:carboxypeptidase M32 [Bacteroidota bacterium]